MKTNNIDITWEEIEKYLEKDSYKEFLRQVPLSVFEMAREEQNRSKVVETVLKTLREHDPRNATEEYAQNMVDFMQKVAKRLLEQRRTSK